MRGTFGSFNQVGISIAIFICYCIGTQFITGTPEELSKYYLWRLAMALPGILSIIQGLLLIFVFKYDSTQHYIFIGQKEKV